jgi:hypothetical protein
MGRWVRWVAAGLSVSLALGCGGGRGEGASAAQGGEVGPAATPHQVLPPPAAEPGLSPAPEATAELVSFEDPATGRWGFSDVQGAVVIAPRFDHVDELGSGALTGAVLDGRWVWIDRQGTVLPTRPFVFDNGTDPFVEGLARYVDESGRLGFIDSTGAVAIPARFAFVHPFAERRAAFCEGCRLEQPAGDEHTQIVGGLWGFIDPAGTEVIPARYTQVSDFEAGISRVCTPDGGCLELRPDGSVVAPKE